MPHPSHPIMHEASLTIVLAIFGHALYTQGHLTTGGIIMLVALVVAFVSTIMEARH